MTAVHRSLPERGQGAATSQSDRQPASSGWYHHAVSVCLPLLLYLRTMAPTVYGLDSAELTAGAYLLGIVHAPGSPTFLLLGHLFTYLPFGDVGYRVNLLTACAAAIAIGCTYATLSRLHRDRLLSLAGALYLATTYYFWVAAVAAELYALHAAFIAALLWLALRWREDPEPRILYTLCFVYGIGLGNHLSLSVLAPGFLWLIVAGVRYPWETRWRVLLLALACGVAGTSVYLYLPIRAAAGVPMNYARDFGIDVTTWSGFWWMVSGSMFGAELFGVPVTKLPLELASYIYRLWSNFLGLGFVLGVWGLIVDGPRRRDLHIGLALLFAGHATFAVTYSVADKELMLLPTFLIWSFWVVLGAREAAAYLRRHTSGAAAISATLLLLIMTAANVALNFARVDISEDWSAHARGDVLLRWLPAESLYLGTWADAPIIEYFQLVEGRRPDLRLVNVFLVRGARRQALVDAQLAGGGSVYASAPLNLSRKFVFELDESCNCYKVIGRQIAWCPAPPPPAYQSRLPPWPLPSEPAT